MFPVGVGVHLIGVTTIIEASLLLWQINSVTDDASSKGEVAGPRFYYMSYACILPFAYSIFTFFKYWACRYDNLSARASLYNGNAAVFYSIIALYFWFLVYFANVEEHDWTVL